MLDLALGLGDEAKADLVAEASSHRADGESAGIPQWIKQARAVVQFLKALGAPSEVVLFFACGFVELSADGGVPGK
jgi:adenylate kinase family enzyme